MPNIRLQNVSTAYCLNNINLDVRSGEFLVMLGSTGAGKSTLLNVISGLDQYTGDIYFNNQNINSIPASKRGAGYLMQEIFLFPHMTIFENVTFGLRALSMPRQLVAEKTQDILDMLRISHLKNRYPKNLSGGEKQRAGLARSLVTEPTILLLDEPLSSLDSTTADQIHNELLRLHKRLNLTILYVTHNLMEARKLADRIVVISGGRVTRSFDPEEILSNDPAAANNLIYSSI
ncbi:MAG: ABC transporter ATP-binding protein [Nitrospirae bacterium]|nr:ABC transporter ATP-binding protein [Nitrospirota bacterium]